MTSHSRGLLPVAVCLGMAVSLLPTRAAIGKSSCVVTPVAESGLTLWRAGPKASPDSWVFVSRKELVRLDRAGRLGRYRLPESLQPSLSLGDCTCDQVPGDSSPWIGWFHSGLDESALYLLRASPAQAMSGELEFEKLMLPPRSIWFAFVAFREMPWLIALEPDRMHGISLHADSLGQTQRLLDIPVSPASAGFVRGSLHEFQWVMDIDGDGAEDLLLPGSESIHIYLQDGYMSLCERDPIEMRHTITLAKPTAASSQLLFLCRTPEIWMEPCLEADMPNMTVHLNNSLYTYRQYERGRFKPAFDEEARRKNVTFAQTLECRLAPGGPKGLLHSIVEDRTSLVYWRSGSLKTPIFRQPYTCCPPFLVDIDRDGAVELFVLEIPSLRRAISELTRQSGPSLTLGGTFVSWLPRRKLWARHPTKVEMTIRAPDSVRAPFSQFEEKLAVGCDLDGDGCGDIAWVDPSGAVKVGTLRKASGGLRMSKAIQASTGLNVMAIIPWPQGLKRSDALLLRCEQTETRGRDEDRPTEEDYYLLRMER